MRKLTIWCCMIGFAACTAAKWLLWGTWLLQWEPRPNVVITLIGVGIVTIGYAAYVEKRFVRIAR